MDAEVVLLFFIGWHLNSGFSFGTRRLKAPGRLISEEEGYWLEACFRWAFEVRAVFVSTKGSGEWATTAFHKTAGPGYLHLFTLLVHTSTIL